MRFLVLLLVSFSSIAVCYKPVILMHGVLADDEELLVLEDMILKTHPKTEILRITLYDNLFSVFPMWHQVQKIIPMVQDFMSKHEEGVHLLGYSQGGLISRAILEMTEHNVDTFISLSSPQGGQFGVTNVFRKFLPAALANYTREDVYKFFYSTEGQLVSLGGYWYDPHHLDKFRDPELRVFLATLNNQTDNPSSLEYKDNFLKLKHMVMISGPDDLVITPWQSSYFAAYDENEEVLEMQEQPWYIEDSFGLRTMDKLGKLHKYTIPGVYHTHWYRNASVFDCCIVQWLT